jgi:MFS transporter, DHA1 family, multidrug resistance protein
MFIPYHYNKGEWAVLVFYKSYQESFSSRMEYYRQFHLREVIRLPNREFSVLCTVSFLLRLGLNIPLAFFPYFVRHLGVNRTSDVILWSGVLMTASYLTASFMSPFWGKWIDRFGSRVLVTTTALGMGITVLLMSVCTSPFSLLFLRLLIGILMGGQIVIVTLVARNSPPEQVARSMSRLEAIGLLGAIIGPIFGGFLERSVSYETFFLLASIPFFIVTFISHKWIAGFTCLTKDDAPESPTLKGGEMRTIFQSEMFWVCVSTMAIAQFAVLSVEPNLPHLLRYLHIHTRSPELVGLLFALPSAGTFLFLYMIGPYLNRWKLSKVLQTAIFGMVLAYVSQIFVSNLTELLLIRLVLGLCIATTLPVVNSLLKISFPPELHGHVFGYNQRAYFFGMVSGGLLGSWLITLTGISKMLEITTGFIAICSFYLLMVLRRMAVPVGEEAEAPMK